MRYLLIAFFIYAPHEEALRIAKTDGGYAAFTLEECQYEARALMNVGVIATGWCWRPHDYYILRSSDDKWHHVTIHPET